MTYLSNGDLTDFIIKVAEITTNAIIYNKVN